MVDTFEQTHDGDPYHVHVAIGPGEPAIIVPAWPSIGIGEHPLDVAPRPPWFPGDRWAWHSALYASSN